MVKISAVLSLLAAVAAADMHADLHQRGSVAPVYNSFTTSAPAASYPATTPEETTPCETETTPVASSYPATTPEETTPVASSYPATTPQDTTPVASSYPATTPEETTPCETDTTPVATSTYPATTPEETTPVASSYPATTPEETTPVASSYPATTPEETTPVASSYPATTPEETTPLASSTSTSYISSTQTYTVTGGSPAPAESCPAVTVTVTEGHPAPAPAPSSYSAAPAPASSSYSAAPAPAKASGNSYLAKPAPAKAPAKSPASAGGKRGIAYSDCQPQVSGAKNQHWAHNWAPEGSGLPSNIEYVPALKDMSMRDEFHNAVASGNYKTLMFINEADMNSAGGGSPMTPQECAQAYKDNMQQYESTHECGAPSVTSSQGGASLNGLGSASGLEYLEQFAAACDGCKPAFACAHWYGNPAASGSEQAQEFIAYIKQFTSTVQRLFGADCKVVIDEFSAMPTCDTNTENTEQFLQAAVPWLEQNPDVSRYSYFAYKPNMFADANGNPTPLFDFYDSL